MRRTNFDHQFSATAALFSEKVRGRVRFVFKIAPNLQVNEANYVLLRQYDMLMDIPINFMFFYRPDLSCRTSSRHTRSYGQQLTASPTAPALKGAVPRCSALTLLGYARASPRGVLAGWTSVSPYIGSSNHAPSFWLLVHHLQSGNHPLNIGKYFKLQDADF